MIWITGFPNSGKTTLAKHLVSHFKSATSHTPLLLDGDLLRDALSSMIDVDRSYDVQYRLTLSYSYSRLGVMLEQQGFLAIVSTVSMNTSVWSFNRQLDPHYIEVYLKEDFELMLQRDIRSIYKNLSASQVADKYSSLPRPHSPDFVLPVGKFSLPSFTKSITSLVNRIYS